MVADWPNGLDQIMFNWLLYPSCVFRTSDFAQEKKMTYMIPSLSLCFRSSLHCQHFLTLFFCTVACLCFCACLCVQCRQRMKCLRRCVWRFSFGELFPVWYSVLEGEFEPQWWRCMSTQARSRCGVCRGVRLSVQFCVRGCPFVHASVWLTLPSRLFLLLVLGSTHNSLPIKTWAHGGLLTRKFCV